MRGDPRPGEKITWLTVPRGPLYLMTRPAGPIGQRVTTPLQEPIARSCPLGEKAMLLTVSGVPITVPSLDNISCRPGVGGSVVIRPSLETLRVSGTGSSRVSRRSPEKAKL